MDRVNAILKDLTAFVPEADLDIRRLLKDSEESIKAHPAFGHAALGSVYQIMGNAEKARYHMENAIKLAPSEHVLLANYSSILANLGFYCEALRVYERAADPKLGQMTWAWPQGYVFGAFTTMVKHLKRARKMKFDLKGLDVETAEKGAVVLERTEISESQVAAALEFVGATLRDHKLFYVGPTPRVAVYDEPGQEPFIRMTYSVAVSSSIAHEIYLEFVDRAVKAHVPIPNFLSVSVRSAKPDHARKAA